MSDGYEKTIALKEFDGPQEVTLDGFHTISWMRLDTLIKAEHPSPYQSLSQWEVYGRDVR